MSPANHGEEEALFPIEAVQPAPENRENDFSSDERVEHLIEALDLYDEVAKIEAEIRKFNNRTWLKEQQETLGKNVTHKWRRQKHEKHQKVLDEAKHAFMQAYPVDFLVEIGLSEQEAVQELDRRYGIFEAAYRGTSQGRHAKREKARNDYQEHLVDKSGEVIESETAGVDASREQRITTSVAETAIQNTVELEVASTKEKLIGLRDDSRAGFLPTTHTEKNQAFEILDYADNPQYPTSINKRLDEIFRHQQKIAEGKNIQGREKYTYAIDSVRSVVNEWSDHLQEAIRTHAELTKLKELLESGISPHINLVEATEPDGEQTFDYNVLVQYVDLKKFRDGQTFSFDPLKTKEDRSIIHDTKNKIIENQYTAFGSLIEIQEFIDAAAEKLSVKDGRQLVEEALSDQAARRLFWYRALKAVDQQGFKEIAERALDEAMHSVS
jgi:hypothetical protein